LQRHVSLYAFCASAHACAVKKPLLVETGRTGAASQQLKRDSDKNGSEEHDSPFVVLEDNSDKRILHVQMLLALQKTSRKRNWECGGLLPQAGSAPPSFCLCFSLESGGSIEDSGQPSERRFHGVGQSLAPEQTEGFSKDRIS
jgi:hypothetical protein